jgi:hypothetical protein
VKNRKNRTSKRPCGLPCLSGSGSCTAFQSVGEVEQRTAGRDMIGGGPRLLA